MSHKPLHIPPTKKLKGLKVHCYECGTTVDTVCRKTNTPIASCKHGQDHVFKAFAHVPGTYNTRKTKTLDTHNLDEARRLTLEFQKEIKDGTKSASVEIPQSVLVIPQVPTQIRSTKTYNLLELMARYFSYMHNDPELVAEHRKKERSAAHLKQVKRILNFFVTALRKNKYDVAALRVDQIDEQMIGKFHSYLLDDLHYGSRSYNRAISILTSFYNYLARDGYHIGNPFVTITRKSTKDNIETIEQEEFFQLLALVQKPELGIKTLSTGKRKNFYKPWMKEAFELGLYTGRRREEVARMKWNDIVFDKDGNPLCITVPDLKINRQKRNTEENLKYNYAPMTAELWSLLERMGISTYNGSDKYLIAPEEKIGRQTVCKLLSRAFSHYYKHLHTGRDLTFGCLRRTNFSHLSGAIGLDNAQTITGHSSTAIMKKHYVSKQVLAATAKNFSIWKAEPEVQNKELKDELAAKEITPKGLEIDR